MDDEIISNIEISDLVEILDEEYLRKKCPTCGGSYVIEKIIIATIGHHVLVRCDGCARDGFIRIDPETFEVLRVSFTQRYTPCWACIFSDETYYVGRDTSILDNYGNDYFIYCGKEKRKLNASLHINCEDFKRDEKRMSSFQSEIEQTMYDDNPDLYNDDCEDPEEHYVMDYFLQVGEEKIKDEDLDNR